MVDMTKQQAVKAIKRILCKDAYRSHQDAHKRVERAIDRGDMNEFENAIFSYVEAAKEGMKRYHAFIKAS